MPSHAGVVELVDTLDLDSSGGDPVQVQVLSPAPRLSVIGLGVVPALWYVIPMALPIRGGMLKITVTAAEPKDSELKAKLIVSADDVAAAVRKAYKDIANKYRFQGFRKGHAPRPVIDGLVGRSAVLAQASEDLLNDATPLMLDQLDVVPLGQPSFGDTPVLAEEGKDFELSATIPLRPDCELDSYDPPEIDMPPAEVTDAEVDEQIETLVGYHTTFEDGGEDYKAAPGDMLTIDIADVENGAALAGEDRPYMIGSSSAPAEFDEALTGMGVGETKEVSFTIEGGNPASADYEVQAPASTDAKVTITLKSAKHRVVPVLDDAFAKKTFGFDSVADFRAAVAEQVAKDKEAQLPDLKETRVIQAVATHLTLEELPEDYVKQVFDEIAREFLGQLQRQGVTLDQWLQARRIQASDFLNDLNEQATERARESLALDALAKHLDLEASEMDVRSEIEKAGTEDVEAAITQFTRAGQMPALRASIRRRKAVEWLLENANVNEVDEVAVRRAERDTK